MVTMATIQLPIQIWLFLIIPEVTYLFTKIEGGLKLFISNFASLSWRIVLKLEIVLRAEIYFFPSETNVKAIKVLATGSRFVVLMRISACIGSRAIVTHRLQLKVSQ